MQLKINHLTALVKSAYFFAYSNESNIKLVLQFSARTFTDIFLVLKLDKIN